MNKISKTLRCALPLTALLLSACLGGGGGGGSTTTGGGTTSGYTIGGTASGLSGTVVLQNNGGDDLTVSANGNFTFATGVADNGTYVVTVLTQPGGQTCSVSTGAGTVSGNNVSNVTVLCSAQAYTVGGTVSGLTGSVVLQDNNGDNLSVSVNGAFTFATAVAQGSPYAVAVMTQPSGQSCSVANGTGTIAGANIGNVAITCASNMFTVGGTVSGLSGTVVLQNNGGDNLTIPTNGSFTFAATVSDGGLYAVTVLTQPANQTCFVSTGAGTVSGGNVTGIALVCAANTFEVIVGAGATSGGTWSGTNPDIFTSTTPMAMLSVTDIQSRLNAGIPVTITTSPAALGNGDISVNSVISWSASKLTLTAHRNIAINANLNGSGTASQALEYGQSAAAVGNTSNYTLNNGAQINLPAGNNFSDKLGSDGAVKNYTVITSLGAADSWSGADLQGQRGGAGNYALGSNIDASATSTWNGGLGFAPISSCPQVFDGLGHTISGLTINRPNENLVGLFASISMSATMKNVGLTGGSISGMGGVGGLAGSNGGTISNSYNTSSVTGGIDGDAVGGLVGENHFRGYITHSYNAGAVTGGSAVTHYYVTGPVTSGGQYVGGLVGYNNGFGITDSYNTGTVTGNTGTVTGGVGGNYVGGLLGYNAGGGLLGYDFGVAITNSYNTGAVSGGFWVGGLVGWTTTNGTNLLNITGSHNSGTVTGGGGIGNDTGGLAGYIKGTITNSYNTGAVNGHSEVGGLAGKSDTSSVISNSHSTGNVTGSGNFVGGVVGLNNVNSNISNAYSTGIVSSTGTASPFGDYVGGLVGSNSGAIANSYSTGAASGRNAIGGLVGTAFMGTITNSYCTGAVTYGAGVVVGGNAGGLAGASTGWGTVTGSYWDTQTSGQAASAEGTGQTTAQMKSQTTFTGWDFAGTWQIVEGVSYPTLR